MKSIKERAEEISKQKNSTFGCCHGSIEHEQGCYVRIAKRYSVINALKADRKEMLDEIEKWSLTKRQISIEALDNWTRIIRDDVCSQLEGLIKELRKEVEKESDRK